MNVKQVNQLTQQQTENLQVAQHRYRSQKAEYFTSFFVERVRSNLATVDTIEEAINTSKEETLAVVTEASALRATIYNMVPLPQELDIALKLANLNKPEKSNDVDTEESSS